MDRRRTTPDTSDTSSTAPAERALGRRRFLQLTGVVALGGALSACSAAAVSSQTTSAAATTTAAARATPTADAAIAGTLPIPPVLAAETQDGERVFRLTMQRGTSSFVPGQTTATYGFNGAYLGPTLRAADGDRVRIEVTNSLGETTTVHWHGMHLPAVMDGGPHQTVADQATWSPAFAIRQQAATLWYHPHLMGDTLRQVGMGLAGIFILDDADPAQDLLPHTYGVDDIPVVLQAQTFGADGQFVLGGGGRGGGGGGTQTTLVNGAISPTVETSRTRLRLRLLNASGEAIYALGLAGGETFHQVASDGGLLPAPVALTRLQLAPAERAEIVVDVPASGSLALQSVVGGGRGDNAAPEGTLLTISAAAQAATAAALPAALTTVERLSPASAAQTREFVLQGGDRNPTINGMSMTSMTDLMDMTGVFEVAVDTTEVWNVVNRSNDPHVFHVHDTQFQIVQRDGAAPAEAESGWKDTVVVSPDETVQLIMRFEDYADPATPYMYHCHLLNHEDAGMMGQFLVV